MMEDYDETTRIDNKCIKPIEEVLKVKMQQQQMAENCNNQQNLNFGAEIIKTTKMHAVQQELEIKTNVEKSIDTTATKTISNIAEIVAVEGEEDVEDDDDDDYDDDSYHGDNDDTHDSQSQQQQTLDSTDDDSTTDSDFSDLSGLSEVSGREWKPISARPINWVQKQIHSGANPRALLSLMLPSSAHHQIAPELNDMTLWRILASMLSEPPRRQKLRHINTFQDVIQLVLQAQNIIVLTGAGVSVSCGIPDFRSSDGIYSRLAKDFPDLPDPQAMFDINYFSRDPRPFFKFAREIYPGQFKPSPCHRFIKLLEQKQKLLRNYTQNIDTLEQVAGIRNVIECHGSFSTASCTKCKFKCNADDIRSDIFAQRIPACPRCQPNVRQSVDASDPVSELELKLLVENGIMKPDIVFFGEGLPEEFHTVMASDKDKCDLLIVMGSSLKVRPVALIPSSIPANVPQILINREQLHHLEFDVELLGDSDVIINQLCHRLGGNDWKEICFSEQVLNESKELLPPMQQLVADVEEEEECCEAEDEAQQLLHDTDTQSIKSNASTDLALRSAGAYSDSGFESSTSSGVVVAGKSGAANAEANVEHTKNKGIDLLLPPHMLEDDEPMDAAHSFQPFCARSSAYAADNYRHLSIDSSKDSGIQCDSSNSALASCSNGGSSALLPPLTINFGESGGSSATAGLNIVSTSASHNTASAVAAEVVTSIKVAAKEKIIDTDDDLKTQQQAAKSRLRAAERLPVGSYYYHESRSGSSYVFPGAQVSWSASDTEEEEDEFDERDVAEEDNVNFNAAAADGDDTNVDPLSPLLPPSVEAEMVSDITTTTATAKKATLIAIKRHSGSDNDCSLSTKTTSASAAVIATSPPLKKRRDSLENTTAVVAATILNATIANQITSSSSNVVDKSFPVSNSTVSTTAASKLPQL